MRKIWLLLVVSIFLFYTAAYYPLFFLRRAEIKHEIKKIMLATNQFDTLSFSPSAFHSKRRNEKGKEFIKEGKMYDVANTIQKNDSIIQITVIEDKEEDNLYRTLRNNTQNSDANSFYQIIKLLTGTIFIIQNQNFFIFIPAGEIEFLLSNIKPSKTFEEVPSPPPRCII